MPKLQPVDLTVDASATSVRLGWVEKGAPVSSYQVKRDGAALTTVAGTVKTYTDTTMLEGATYIYRVESFGFGASDSQAPTYSNAVTVQVPMMDAPTTAPNLSGTAGDAQCSLSWTAVAGANSYQLQRKTTGAFATIATQPNRTFPDTGRTNGTTYTYRVRGTSNNGNKTGPWSNSVALTPAATIPVAPVLTGVAGDNENTLDWNAVAGAATYRVRRAIGVGPVVPLDTTAATDYIDDTAENGTEYHYTVRGVKADGTLGAISNTVDLTPEAVSPPEEAAVVGYAAVAGVTGGTGGTSYNVSNFAQLRQRLEQSGSRIINLTGSAVFDGNGAEFSVNNGNVTVDGTNWTGSMKNYKIIWRCSNVIIREVAWRTGEGANEGASADRRAITFNPPDGGTIDRILLDHCSFAWGPDVVASWLNRVYDMTAQYCIFGPSLYESNIRSGPNGYGPNVTTTTGPAAQPKRHTYYRNLMIFNDKRNFRAHGLDGFDVVNCVMYGWGSKSGHGNPQGANIMNNIYKKGPDTTNSEGWDSEISGGDFNTYFRDSVYFNGNIGRTTAMAAFTLVTTFGPGVARSTPYANGPTHPSHGSLTVATANDALFAAVVAGAGRTHQDAIDTFIKGKATNGTGLGGNGFYNGAGFDPPHPSW